MFQIITLFHLVQSVLQPDQLVACTNTDTCCLIAARGLSDYASDARRIGQVMFYCVDGNTQWGPYYMTCKKARYDDAIGIHGRRRIARCMDTIRHKQTVLCQEVDAPALLSIWTARLSDLTDPRFLVADLLKPM